MSYCRWSSDNFQCDVYVYADVSGGWTTHVATRRYVIDESVLPQIASESDPEEFASSWLARHNALSAQCDRKEFTDLSHLPSAGESFNDPTARACADRLESLRAEGFNVPQCAIDELRAELAEAA